MGGSEKLPEIRSALRQFLKKALRYRVWSTSAKAPTSESEVPPRASPAPPCLPQLSDVSLLPDLESDQFGIDRYNISPAGTVVLLHSNLQSTDSEPRLSLLSATRLSQIDLHGLLVCNDHSPLPRRRTRHETLPEILMEGASQRASISTTKYEPSLRAISSTVKIRQSTRPTSSENHSGSATSALLHTVSSLRRSTTSANLQRSSFRTSLASRWGCLVNSKILRTPALTDGSGGSSGSNASIHSIKHFGSFCVLDTFASGSPVTATSEDLCYVFQIGDHFMLNIQECKCMSTDIITAYNPDGEEVIHLVLFSPLLSPSTGTSRFLLAALVDVTHFLHEASWLPDPGISSEGLSIDDQIDTPAIAPPQSSWSTRHYELLPEDLLGGCSVSAKLQSRRDKSHPAVCKWEFEDDWRSPAGEKRLEKDWQLGAKGTTRELLGFNRPQSLRTGSARLSKSSSAWMCVLVDLHMPDLWWLGLLCSP